RLIRWRMRKARGARRERRKRVGRRGERGDRLLMELVAIGAPPLDPALLGEGIGRDARPVRVLGEDHLKEVAFGTVEKRADFTDRWKGSAPRAKLLLRHGAAARIARCGHLFDHERGRALGRPGPEPALVR